MLKELSIRNFAIIDDLRIEFSKGLTVLSGETGAGKSIIINALNLVLGGRAYADLIRTGAESAEVEAFFDIAPGSRTYQTLKEYDLGPEDGLLIRRIVSRNSRHRIYVNGRTATIAQLLLLTENLAGVSGQHAHQGLLKETFQLEILDQFGGLMPIRDEVHRCYSILLPLIRKLEALTTKAETQARQLELLEFQKKEITEAGVQVGEDDELALEKDRLKNGELLSETVYGCIDALYDRRGSVMEELTEATKNLEKISRFDPAIGRIQNDIEEAAYRLEDITASLRSYMDSLEIDSERLEWVEVRLDTLVKLKRKYGGTLTAVCDHLAQIETDLTSLENLSHDIEVVKQEIIQSHEQLCMNALRLSDKRQSAAETLAVRVENELRDLKMEGTRFSAVLSVRPADPSANPSLVSDGRIISETGMDRVVFMISPNVGETLKPLAEIASGGELSRIVLALKSILAHSESTGTLIFDEVDAGIGGGTAEVVGKKMLALSRYHQIICITHLPQIATFADHHFTISKQVENGRTRTRIARIPKEERAKEIARMLGGDRVTKKTLAHAAEMLDQKP
ncbi:MAG: DNA repair protein RecN [Desulfobacterales bacterium]